LDYYKKLTEKGHIIAQIIFGYLYENGKSVEKDLEEPVY